MAVLTLTANHTGRTIRLLAGSTDTGYYLMADSDWGNGDVATTFGGPRGKLGARPAFGVPQNRTLKHHFRVRAGSGKDGLGQLIQAAYVVCEDVRRFGGTLLWQSSGQSKRQFFDVLTCQTDIDWSGNNAETLGRPEFTITHMAAPFAEGDPMDTIDDFSIDTIARGDWTKDGAGAATISGGYLHPTTSTALVRYRHSLKGYLLGDVEVTMRFATSASISGGLQWGVSARCDAAGADTMITAEVVPTTNVIRLRKYIAGTGTDLATAAFTPSALTTYWVRLRLEGTRWTAEVFTTLPTPVSTPTATVTYAPTADEASRFAVGHTGIRSICVSSDLIGPWSSKPYTARLLQTPDHIALIGAVPGDVAAKVDIELTPLGGTGSPVFGMVGVLERPLVNNLCWNGDFESATIGTDGWTNAAVAGVIGAATSIARDTTAARVKFGSAGLQFITPATTDTGPSFLIRRRFSRRSTYAIVLWASAASSTTQCRPKLGVSGDLAAAVSGAALSTTPKPYAVIWQPSADRDFAYAAFGTLAATATTATIDGVCVVENPTVLALSASVGSGATTLPIYATLSDLPAVPFLALVDQEWYRVTAVSATSFTVDPGAEGSVQTTHASGAQVVILPASRRELEGAGAWEPMDIIEGESYVPSLSSVTGTASISASSDDRGGSQIVWSGMSAGVAGVFTWFVDPSLIVPDDYTLGEVDVEVWARIGANALGSLKLNVSCLPDGGATKGAERFTREWGNVGRFQPLPPSTVFRFTRIGTIPMIVDRSNPLRWQLRLSITPSIAGGIGIDYLMLVPIRNRLASPTAKVNDSGLAGGAYPPLVPWDGAWGSSSAMTKTLRADGSGLIAEVGKPAYPDHGLGRILELPAGDCDLIVKLSNLVPDDPTVDATNEMFTAAPSYATSVHAAVTPRYALIRGS